jgi:DNA-binding transcriptional ArsR family regulator
MNASGGVGELADRIGIDQKILSGHLTKLKDMGLLFSHRQGKHNFYQPAEDRVRYQRQGDGRFSLAVIGRGGGVAVTISMGAPVSDGAS